METAFADGQIDALWVPVAALLERGGLAMAGIGALSVLLLALTLWKLWRLVVSGAFARRRAGVALASWCAGDRVMARELARGGRGPRARLLDAAFDAAGRLPTDRATEETARVGKRLVAEAQAGLRAIELISLVAPLLGLMGTVLGMIAAFRALEASGGAADPATLAGGIWEALLTTAAGMGVAIPALLALALFEGIADRMRLDLEDLATRVFTAPDAPPVARAAE